MTELRDIAQISDHVPDVSLARTSARQARVEREWRVTRERKSWCLAPRVCLALASARLKKIKNTFLTNFLRPNTVFQQYLCVTWLTASSIL